MRSLPAWLTYIWVYIHSRASARIYTHTPFDLYDNTSGTRMGGVGGGWPNFPSALNKLPPAICGLQTGAALTAQYVFCILLCVRHMETKIYLCFACTCFIPQISASYLYSSGGPIDYFINADGGIISVCNLVTCKFSSVFDNIFFYMNNVNLAKKKNTRGYFG